MLKPMTSRYRSNSRGEWFVIGQFALFALIAFGPRTVAGLPGWSLFWIGIGSIAGAIFFAAGGLLALAGVLKLGRRNFTPFVCPKAGGILLEQGPYRLVRHPIYSGLIFMGFGWGLWVHGWLTLGYTLLLFTLLDCKSRREERWLEMSFPGYAGYRKRVRRFIPFLY